MVSSTNYEINYHIGWAIVTDAFSPYRKGEELRRDSVIDQVRKRMIAAGKYGPGVRLVDETDAMEDWERRRTRKEFNRPKGMFLVRIVDKTGENGIGQMEMNEWPQR